MTAPASLAMINVDCADPRTQAAFYGQILGWEVTHSDAEYAMITNDGTSIGFGRVAGYQPPQWPDTGAPKRYHLDMYVDDMDQAEKQCLALGASRPDFQPGGERWRVLLDPSGQPFCICPRPSEA